MSDFRFRALISVVFQPLCPACSLFLFRRINDDDEVSSVNPSVLTFTRTQVHVSNQLESLAQEPLLFILFVTVPVPVPVQRSYSRRSGHDEMYQVPYARTNVYKYSFVPATVRTWNTLPATLIHSHSLQSFKTGVSVYIRH